jgi:hypothetical protein
VRTAASVQLLPKKFSHPRRYVVERGDTATERLSPCSRRQLAESRVDADFRPLRQENFSRADLRIAPKAEADEVPFFGSRDRTLGLIHLEAQPPLDEPDHTGHHTVPRAFASDVDVRVVGVAHEVVAAPGTLAVEFVQHDVTEQRRQRPTLRHALLRAYHHAVWHYHLGFQHPVNEHDEPSVTSVTSCRRFVVRCSTEPIARGCVRSRIVKISSVPSRTPPQSRQTRSAASERSQSKAISAFNNQSI